MKTETVIHLVLGAGLIGFAAFAINKMNKQEKQIASLKEDVSKAGKLTSTVKDIKGAVDQITNRTKEGV